MILAPLMNMFCFDVENMLAIFTMFICLIGNNREL